MRARQMKWVFSLALMPGILSSAEIAGKVRSHLSGIDFEYGLILINPLRAAERPDTEGNFSIPGLQDGIYEVVCCYDGFMVQRKTVEIDGADVTVNFDLVSGDYDRNASIDLCDMFRFVEGFGEAQVNDMLDFNRDQIIDEEDLDAWYKTAWRTTGHYYRYTLLDNAEKPGVQTVFPGGKWQTHHDDGSSVTVPAHHSNVIPDEDGYYSAKGIGFHYRLGSSADYPYALIRFLFGSSDYVSFDAAEFKGMTVILKGEGQPLIISLKSQVTSDDWSEYYVRIPLLSDSWQIFTLPFDRFKQPDWGEQETINDVLKTLQAIQFRADESVKDQSLSLRIDNLFLIQRDVDVPGSTVQGKIFSAGMPLPAATVSVTGPENIQEVLSGLNGGFTLENPDPGKHTFQCARPGYEMWSADFIIEPGSTINWDEVHLNSSKAQPKPVSTGAVRVVERRLETDFSGLGLYSTFPVKGVGYAPTPIGSWSGDLVYPEQVYERDMPLLQQMGCNTIRTWSQTNILLMDKAEAHDIKVIAGFWVPLNADFYDPSERRSIIESFREYVITFKDHPALLFWSLGNEQNYANGDNWAWYSLVEDLAYTACEIEGEDYHPVSTPNGDRLRIGLADYLTRDADMPSLDIWGMNLYKSDREGFDSTFLLYSIFSSRPLWISEYGIDAYDNRNAREYETEQAVFARNRHLEMMADSVCIGGTLMAYSDEWWKAGDPSTHDPGGYATGAHPDGYSNEEWWGIFRVSKVAGGIDELTRRSIYDTLRHYFKQL